jgi:hypothetical protein
MGLLGSVYTSAGKAAWPLFKAVGIADTQAECEQIVEAGVFSGCVLVYSYLTYDIFLSQKKNPYPFQFVVAFFIVIAVRISKLDFFRDIGPHFSFLLRTLMACFIIILVADALLVGFARNSNPPLIILLVIFAFLVSFSISHVLIESRDERSSKVVWLTKALGVFSRSTVWIIPIALPIILLDLGVRFPASRETCLWAIGLYALFALIVIWKNRRKLSMAVLTKISLLAWASGIILSVLATAMKRAVL